MAIITLTSDFGLEDHYVSAVKSQILSSDAHHTIVDITHQIQPHNITQTAYILKSVFRDFPKKTVHIVAVDNPSYAKKNIAVLIEDHYFIGSDCGIFSLISEQKTINAVELVEEKGYSFVAKLLFVPIALQLAGGKSLKQVGKPLKEINRSVLPSVSITKQKITGVVIHVDHYGNLITNIHKKHVEEIELYFKKSFNQSIEIKEILFEKERFTSIHRTFTDVKGPECFLFFNSVGMLQMGVNSGNAHELLGAKIGTKVDIIF